MSDEAEQAEVNPQRRRFSPAVIVLVFLVLYPLSIGPAAGFIAWLGPKSPIGERVNAILTVFYFPLVWCMKHSDVLGKWIPAYMNWFIR